MGTWKSIKRWPAAFFALVAAALVVTAVAWADVITGDANQITPSIEGSVTVAPPGNGTGKFALVASDNETDTRNGCNANGANPVTLAVSSNQSWLTVTQSTITLTDCDTGTTADGLQNSANVSYSVSSSAPAGGTATVTATYQSGGRGGNYTPGSFQVKTPAATDTTAPSITPDVTGTSGDDGWYVSNVGVSWTVSDAQSSVTSTTGCGASSVTADTSGVTYTCQATSAGGTASKSVTIKRDATKPALVRNAAADDCNTPGTNGWCRGTQTAGFSASDATSGLANGETSPHAFTRSTTENGGAVSIASGTIKDKAGNEASSIDAGPYKIDSVAPAITRNAAADDCNTPGTNGWCRGTQTGGFSVSDATSGLANGETSPHAFTRSTADNGAAVKIASGKVADKAGNEASSIDAGPYKIDSVAPAIARNATADTCPAGGENGWCTGTQTAGFRATDATSGFAPDGDSPLAFTRSTTDNGAAVKIASGAVTDRAGNQGDSIDAGPFKIDSVEPAIVRDADADDCATPGDGGWCKGTQTAGFKATDATSGFAPDGDSPLAFTRSTDENGSAVKIASGTIKDRAGNTGDSIDAGPYKIDSIAPAIVRNAAADSCDDEGANGWCQGTQTAGFKATDATSGFAPDGDSPLVFTKTSGAQQGAAVEIASGAVKDRAGNQANSIDAGPYKIDSIAPVIVRDTDADGCDVPGDDGWCRGTQTAGFSASDATSGLANGETSPDAFTRSSTANGDAVKIASGKVSDLAGNEADSIDAGPYKIDSIAPVVVRNAAADSCDDEGANGWCTGTQTAGFRASDATSGLANGETSPHAFTRSTDENGGAVTIASGTVKDRAGNTGDSVDAGPYKIDSVAPAIVRNATADGCNVPGDAGWCRGTQTAGFKATDATSGFAPNGSTPLLFTKSSGAQGSAIEIASGKVSDLAGNEADSIDAGPFKIDSVAPVIARDTDADSCDDEGANDWCQGVQTAGFEATDATSGFAPDGDSPLAFTKTSGAQQGAAVQIASGTVKDRAGNTGTSIDAGPFKIDSVAPVIARDTDADSCDTPGLAGWCRGTQTAGFEATDATSGFAPDGDSPLAFNKTSTTQGDAIQIASGKVADLAGNEASSIDAGPFKIDSVAPSQPSAATDPENPVHTPWFKGSVKVAFSGSTDATSGGVTYVPAAEVTYNTSGKHSYSGRAKDAAGNLSDAATGDVHVDATAPNLTLTCPSAPLKVGTIASVPYSASDDHSGLVGDANGTVVLNTGSIGAGKTAEKTVYDNVGNARTLSCTYDVVYDFSGFFRPIDNLPTLNVAKAGSAVPVKFSLDGPPVAGSNTSGKGPEASVATMKSGVIACDPAATADTVETTTTAGNSSLTYDASADQWVYVWKTDKGWTGCRQLVVELADGSPAKRVNFKFTK